MFDIKGKIAIVTGPRTGIGQSAAVALAKAGVHIMGIGTSPMDETKQLVEAQGVRFEYQLRDLSKPCKELFERIVEETVEKLGRIDILVNNAGTRHRGESLDYEEDAWDAVMNVNVKSVFFLTQAVAKQFLKQGDGGKVVNLASLLSFFGGFKTPAYAASKSAVASLTKSLSNEWAKLGINVNAIAAGYIETIGTQALRDDPVRNQQILDRIPAGRWGEPDEIGEPIVFLCTPAARYIHGAIISVDGGWMGR